MIEEGLSVSGSGGCCPNVTADSTGTALTCSSDAVGDTLDNTDNTGCLKTGGFVFRSVSPSN